MYTYIRSWWASVPDIVVISTNKCAKFDFRTSKPDFVVMFTTFRLLYFPVFIRSLSYYMLCSSFHIDHLCCYVDNVSAVVPASHHQEYILLYTLLFVPYWSSLLGCWQYFGRCTIRSSSGVYLIICFALCSILMIFVVMSTIFRPLYHPVFIRSLTICFALRPIMIIFVVMLTTFRPLYNPVFIRSIYFAIQTKMLILMLVLTTFSTVVPPGLL